MLWDKSGDTMHSFYGELKHALNQFPKYHMKILVKDLNVKAGREDNFKPTIRNNVRSEVFTVVKNQVKWRQHGPLKHWYPTITLHSVTTQKTVT
jgi:hypothetical protein